MGLREMRQAGGRSAAQDETGGTVSGMPHEAVKLGTPDEVVPLPGIARWIVHGANQPRRAPA